MAAHGFEVESFGLVRLKKRQNIREVHWHMMDETVHEEKCEYDR